MKMLIALQVYSVRQDAEADLKGTLQTIKDMGYDGVEFAGLYGHTPEQVRTWCEQIGLTPISAHVPYPDMIADPEGVLSDYASIGCSYVAIPWLGEEERPGGAGFSEALAHIRTLGAVAKDKGMQLLYHNHDFEFVRLQGVYGLDMLYDSVPSELLATELDTCWVNVGGADPVAYLRKYTGRAPVVHLKDFVGTKNEHMYELIGTDEKAPERPGDFEFRPVGHGVQDMPSILRAAEEAGASWCVVEQDSPSLGKTPMECARMSMSYLRSIGV
ncbi:MAG: sugar phosphate isomerase/epimerase [Clostridia bacterium]|nr:sugar phosphate isomerase/epimerase [Clostridia bacterium]